MARSKQLLSPQQKLFLSLYTNPKSSSFGNAYQSALAAKYSKKYAENITDKDLTWLGENVGDTKLLKKAVKVLDDTLEMDDYYESEHGSRRDPHLTKIKQDSAKFVASTVGKRRFSTRSPMLDDEGNPIPIPIYAGASAKTIIEVQGHDVDPEGLPAPKED